MLGKPSGVRAFAAIYFYDMCTTSYIWVNA